MRYLVLVLLGLSLAILLGNMLSRDSGLILLSYGGYDIQMSLSVFVVLSLFTFLLCYLLFRLLGGIWRFPKNFNRWSKHRRHRRAEKLMNRGVLAELEGNWKEAEECFKRGANYSSTPMANYLAAARAAQHQGAMARRDLYLGLAHDEEGNTGLALGLTQAKLQLGEGQTEQAYATLNQLATEQGEDRQVRSLLLEAASELGEWPQALKLLDDARNSKALSKNDFKTRQIAVFAGLLREADSETALESYWEQVPGRLRDEALLIESYVIARLKYQNGSGCELLLRKALKRNWNEALVRLYGLVDSGKLAKQIQFAERLLESQRDSAALHLALGRLCKKHNLWGKAKNYLQESLQLGADVEACQVMALLLEEQGEPREAAEYFRKGVALATGIDNGNEAPPLLQAPGDAPHSADADAQQLSAQKQA